MNNTAIIQLLTDTGHLSWPRGFENTEPIGRGPTIHSPCVHNAIASYQEYMVANLEPLSLIHHHRPARCDGELGPATMELFAQPRCGCCDYGPDVQPATGNGSWAGCHGIGDFHSATVYVDKSGMPSFLEPVFEQAWDGSAAAYDAIGLRWKRVVSLGEANIRFTFVSRSNGWIGLAIVGNKQSCNSFIWCKFLSTYKPSNILGSWTELIMHELGHNAGLQHSRGGIMNPSIITGLKPTWRGDPSESILKRYYGGETVNGGPEPPPPDPPTEEIYGKQTMYIHGKPIVFDVLQRAITAEEIKELYEKDNHETTS